MATLLRRFFVQFLPRNTIRHIKKVFGGVKISTYYTLYHGVGEIPDCAKYASITNFVDIYDLFKEILQMFHRKLTHFFPEKFKFMTGLGISVGF